MTTNILVTGGCGYIGSALVPSLLRNPDIGSVTVLDDLSTGSPRNLLAAGLDRETFEFRQGDVRRYGDVESAMRGVDAVVHLAAVTGAASTYDRREETFAINLDGSENVFTAAEKLDVETVVFASSCNCYGRVPYRNIDESIDPDPLNPYAEAKYEAERLFEEYVRRGAFDGTALRMSTNYGYAPGVRFNLVVNTFVFRALTGRAPTVYGDGSNWRPFIHVDDAARAYEHAACRPERWDQTVYNVGATGENYRIETVAQVIRDEVAPDLDVAYLAEEDPGPSYHVDFERLSKTGFEPAYTLAEGVRELADRFRNRQAEVAR
jgi:nucleoside-diphosphate-sugar epimerase